MIDRAITNDRLAIRCQHLHPTFGGGRGEPVYICNHPAREGRDCIGPFLHDLTTDCGLWEARPDAHLIAAPQPERWQGRRRRGGYDVQRGWR